MERPVANMDRELLRLFGEFKQMTKDMSVEEIKARAVLPYNKESSPDYTDPYKACMYLMRYSKTYMYQLSKMYEIAMANLNREHVTAYVFGDGPRIDEIALAQACYNLNQDLQRNHITGVKYRGIDSARWGAYVCFEWNNIGINFKRDTDVMRMNDYIDRIVHKRCDILSFPRIMGELNTEEVRDFCRKLQFGYLDKRELMLCVTYSANDFWKKGDWEKTQWIICAILENTGCSFRYKLADSLIELKGKDFSNIFEKAYIQGTLPGIRDRFFPVYFGKKVRVDNHVSEYSVPTEIFEYLQRMKESEKNAGGNRHFLPMQNADNLCFQVIHFVREGREVFIR